LSNEFDTVRTTLTDTSTVECLAHCLAQKLSGGAKLLQLALQKHKRLKSLLVKYDEELDKHMSTFARPADKEAFLIKFLVDWELTENTDAPWRFGTKGLTAIREDFVLLADFENGQHMRDLEADIKEWGMFLLEGPERHQYSDLKGDDSDKFLIEHTKDTFRAVWHFLVSVCRALQQGENRLSPSEAYWLGLIDEVPGTKLANLREVFEYAQVVEAEETNKRKTKGGKVRSIAADSKAERETKAARKNAATNRRRAPPLATK
jgi:hypothetical protein